MFQQFELLIQVPETPSTFHPRAQRNASRRRDARLQSRSMQSNMRSFAAGHTIP
jgi:hypothetical protein